MKHMIKTALAVVVMLAFAFSASAQSYPSNEALVKEAEKEVKQCLNDAREPGTEVVSEVETVSICIVSGFITEVKFYVVPKCKDKPNQPPCPRPFPVHAATVTFGCDGNIIASECIPVE
jgi:hypothetical protein